MKILFYFFFAIFFFTNANTEIPIFSSFPLSPLLNYNQISTKVILKCSTPIYITIDNKNFQPISYYNKETVSKWFLTNLPIRITTSNLLETIFPELESFTSFDISLNVPTPQNSSLFVLLVIEDNFFNSNQESVPYSSPLLISRGSSSYVQIPETKNSLSFKKYEQKSIKAWDTKSLDITLVDHYLRVNKSELFLDINLSIPSSGIGSLKIENLVVNIGGLEYKVNTFLIAINKKDPFFNIPIDSIGSPINVLQEVATKSSAFNPGDSIVSNRDEFYKDVLKIQDNTLVCLEEPTLFIGFKYSDIDRLEQNSYLSFKFRASDSSDIYMEYLWIIDVGWQKIPLLNRGFVCQFQDFRNQFCPFCNNVNHRLKKTDYSYNVFRSTKEYLVDYGLDVSVEFPNGVSSFYFNNENDNYLGDHHLSILFNITSYTTDDISESYILIPNKNPYSEQSAYYIWLKEINSGCQGINISYSDFYNQAACQLPQYSCSNIHYFRDTQNQTLFINNNLNYLFGNYRSGISFLNEKTLSVERLQTKLNLILSIYVPNLSFLQPFINQINFESKQSDSIISIFYSFLNNGSMNGDYSIEMGCNDTAIGVTDRGTIENNNIPKDYSFSFLKSISKATKYYQCTTKVQVKNQEYWSKTGKEIESTIYFQISPNQIEQKCDLVFNENSIKVEKKEFLEGNKVVFLSKIENNIESIDWYKVRVECLGKQDQIYLENIQIPFGSSKSISITMNSNKSNPKCSISIESYQLECNYVISNKTWDYSSVFKTTTTSSSSSTPSTAASSFKSSLKTSILLLLSLIAIGLFTF